MIYAFDHIRPVIHPSAFVHSLAVITGNVVIGKDVYIGPGVAIRGDWGAVVIEDGCNVQENCVIHMFPNVTVTLRKGAHIGHGAVIHGAVVGSNTLVGMNAVLMDNVVIGDNCIVGALCFVPSGMLVPDHKIIMGNPGRVVKEVSDEMLQWKTVGTRLYQQLPAMCYESLIPCEPYQTLEERPPVPESTYIRYSSWHETRK